MSIAPRLTDGLPDLIDELLRHLGEDPSREGLVDTPERVAQSLRFLTSGYAADVHEVVSGALFRHDSDEMVTILDIPFFSLCEHHLLPFFGTVNVGYLPRGRVLGLSKVPRLVDVFAHRLQLQERLAREIAEAVETATGAAGVAVAISARHLCIEMRGVEKVGGQTVTTSMLGRFKAEPDLRAEFLGLVRTRNS